jgi:CTP synthase (UTP-ammonia lyase)
VDSRARVPGSLGFTVTVNIAIVGDLDPNRESHAATTAALGHVPGATAEWVPTREIDPGARRLAQADAILMAPGEADADAEGAVAAIRYARERGVPLVGT